MEHTSLEYCCVECNEKRHLNLPAINSWYGTISL